MYLYFCKCIDCMCMYIINVIALNKTQWAALITGRYMITMMVLLCYVNLSGMSLECIVIVLINNSLLGGQFCTDSIDVQQDGDNQIGRDRLAIIPRLNFTCNGRITSIRAKVRLVNRRSDYPFFQVWRATSINSTMYNKIGEVQLQSDNQVTGSGNYRTANIILTGNNTIEVQSGDVVGYYHPYEIRYHVRTIQTGGYRLYQFNESSKSVNLSIDRSRDERQPLIQFTIGNECQYYTLSQLAIIVNISIFAWVRV